MKIVYILTFADIQVTMTYGDYKGPQDAFYFLDKAMALKELKRLEEGRVARLKRGIAAGEDCDYHEYDGTDLEDGYDLQTELEDPRCGWKMREQTIIY